MIEVNLEITLLSNAPMPSQVAHKTPFKSEFMDAQHFECVWEEGNLFHVQYHCTLGTHLIVLKINTSLFPEEYYVIHIIL